MFRATGKTLLVAACLAWAVAASADPSNGARTIVLFGAHWCVPCRAELRDLHLLARAAAPDRLVLAWIGRVRPGSNVPDVAILSQAEAESLFDRLSPSGRGLPFSVVLDGDGAVCAEWRRRMRVENVEKLRQSCKR